MGSPISSASSISIRAHTSPNMPTAPVVVGSEERLPSGQTRESYCRYQADYFQRMNADPVWREKRLAKIRAWKLRKKLEGTNADR